MGIDVKTLNLNFLLDWGDLNKIFLLEHQSSVSINQLSKDAIHTAELNGDGDCVISFKANVPFIFYIKDDLNLYFIGHYVE